MEKTRVKKGENYWYVTPTGFVSQTYDTGDLTDKLRFEFGNYFYTSGEAESMAKKLRAVLNGADVIEMPSEKEIEAVAYRHCGPLAEWSGSAVNAFIEATDWVKSKIVK